MKSQSKASLAWTTVMILFVAVILYKGMEYPKEVRIIPFVVGIPTLILLLVLWVSEFWPGLHDALHRVFAGSFGARPGEAETKAKTNAISDWRAELVIMAWVFLFFAFTFLFGFFLVSPVFIIIFLVKKAGLRWPWAIFSAVMATVALFSGLQRLLKVDLWAGAIPTIIPGILGGSIVPPL